MRHLILLLLSALLIVGRAVAQNTPAPPMINPTGGGAVPLKKESSIDQVLDALDARGKGLKSFTGDVKLAETDAGTGDTQTRAGTAVYQLKPAGNARIYVISTSGARGENQ